MTVTRTPFFTLPNGSSAELITLSGADGVSVSISNFGATITHFFAPDRNQDSGDIVLGYENPYDYLTNAPYLGSTVGRYANRIAHGDLFIAGQHYQLAKNHGAHHLHGGNLGFSHRLWHVYGLEDGISPKLTLTLTSPDGDQGYPGDVYVRIEFTLLHGVALRIDYYADSSAPTVISLTDHSYFNLSAGTDSTIYDHWLTVASEKLTKVRSDMLPSGELQNVAGSALDLRQPKKIGDILKSPNDQQIHFGSGLDHNYVLLQGNIEANAMLMHPHSGRGLKVYTDKPGLQVYSANFLGEIASAKRGTPALTRRAGICLETQHFPDAPNIANFAVPLVKPGMPYHYFTIYKPITLSS